jgi:outer membrane protein OmpA-like peptidoglycan-associated protein
MSIFMIANRSHSLMKKISLIILAFFLSAGAFAQGKLIPGEAYDDARQYILSNDYTEAYFLLTQLSGKGYDNANINYLCGLCCLHLPGKRNLAVEYLQRAVLHISTSYEEDKLSESNAPPPALYYLGIAYRMTGKIAEAEKTFQQVQEELILSDETKSLLRRELEYCRMSRIYQAIPVHLKQVDLGNNINTDADEYNPSVSADEKRIIYMNSRKFYDAVNMSEHTGDGWGLPDEITSQLGSDGEYTVISLAADGNTMILRTYDMYAGGELYFSEYRDQRWQKKQKFPFPVNTGYSETFGSFSPDGKSLYFTSNRPGGKGGFDIYRSDRNTDGTWGAAINLGSDVNSPEDEASPFLAPGNRYFWFSSRGHSSIGGYDIFRCTVLPDGYSWPVNLGSPLNTNDDDLLFVPVEPDNAGYMAIPGELPTGYRDIRRFELLSIPDPNRFSIDIRVLASDSASLLSIKAQLNYTGPSGQHTLVPDSTGLHFSGLERSGDFIMKATAQGYEPAEKAFHLSLDEKISTHAVKLFLKKIIIQPDTTSFVSPPAAYFLGDIYFPFESTQLSSRSQHRLDSLITLLGMHPGIAVTLTGFADLQGPAWYNQYLSEMRALVVRQYLIAAGIDPGRITAAGKGEANQITIDLNPETRKWNRRVEIRISQNNTMPIHYLPPPVPISYLINQ